MKISMISNCGNGNGKQIKRVYVLGYGNGGCDIKNKQYFTWNVNEDIDEYLKDVFTPGSYHSVEFKQIVKFDYFDRNGVVLLNQTSTIGQRTPNSFSLDGTIIIYK